jgi:hypothetical protein
VYSDHLVANEAIDKDSPAARKTHPMGFSGLRAAINPPINPKAAKETIQTAPGPSTSNVPTHAKAKVPRTSASVRAQIDHASTESLRRLLTELIPASCSVEGEPERVLARQEG